MTTLTPASTPARAPGLDLGLTALHVLIGVMFVAHGLQRFFEVGIPGTVGAFTRRGVPLPGLTAPLVAGLERLARSGSCWR